MTLKIKQHLKKIPTYLQTESKDCGPTCLKIIAEFYGKILKIQELRDYSETTLDGSNLLMLSDAAERFGFRTIGVKRSRNLFLYLLLFIFAIQNPNFV